MSTILSLAPQNVWKHFYSLTQIPRPSGHMEKVTEFLINFGKGLGLESFVDEAGLFYKKPMRLSASSQILWRRNGGKHRA